MNYAAVSAALGRGKTATWDENEIGSERQARFEVEESKWSHIVGRAVVRVTLGRGRPVPSDSYYHPQRFIGSATYAVEDGEQGYRRARIVAYQEALTCRTAVESEYDR